MEFEVFLAARILHPRRDRDMGGLNRAFAENRKFLEHEPEIGLRLQEIEHVGHRPLAEAAIVVEELDHRDLALRIAEHHLVARIEQSGVIVFDRCASLLGVRLFLLLFHRGHDVLHHLRMTDEVILDDPLDLVPLFVGKRLRQDRRCYKHRRREQCGEECRAAMS